MIFSYWYNPDKISDKIEENEILFPTIEDWAETYDKFHIFSDTEVLPIFDSFNTTYADLYQRIRIPACRADIARLMLLYKYGGMYLDPHVGTASNKLLFQLIETLSSKELILFDKREPHMAYDDKYIANFSILARQKSQLIKMLVDSAFCNLQNHEMMEAENNQYMPYNIFVLTGPYNINQNFFDRNPDGLYLKSEISELIHIERLDHDKKPWPIQPYKHYGYRQPNQHWSERQKTELLFEPRITLSTSQIDNL